MKQTTKRFISLLAGLVLLVSALIVYFEFVQPAYYDIQEIKSRQLGQQFFLESEQGAIKKVQDLISAYQAQGNVQEAVSLSLPLEEKLSGALAELYGIARASGLTLSSVAISSGGAQSAGVGGGAGKKLFALQRPIRTIVLNARFGGPYEDLKLFLGRLETNIRVFDTVNFSLQLGGAEKAGPNFFNYDISLLAYSQTTLDDSGAARQ